MSAIWPDDPVPLPRLPVPTAALTRRVPHLKTVTLDAIASNDYVLLLLGHDALYKTADILAEILMELPAWTARTLLDVDWIDHPEQASGKDWRKVTRCVESAVCQLAIGSVRGGHKRKPPASGAPSPWSVTVALVTQMLSALAVMVPQQCATLASLLTDKASPQVIMQLIRSVRVTVPGVTPRISVGHPLQVLLVLAAHRDPRIGPYRRRSQRTRDLFQIAGIGMNVAAKATGLACLSMGGLYLYRKFTADAMTPTEAVAVTAGKQSDPHTNRRGGTTQNDVLVATRENAVAIRHHASIHSNLAMAGNVRAKIVKEAEEAVDIPPVENVVDQLQNDFYNTGRSIVDIARSKPAVDGLVQADPVALVGTGQAIFTAVRTEDEQLSRHALDAPLGALFERCRTGSWDPRCYMIQDIDKKSLVEIRQMVDGMIHKTQAGVSGVVSGVATALATKTIVAFFPAFVTAAGLTYLNKRLRLGARLSSGIYHDALGYERDLPVPLALRIASDVIVESGVRAAAQGAKWMATKEGMETLRGLSSGVLSKISQESATSLAHSAGGGMFSKDIGLAIQTVLKESKNLGSVDAIAEAVEKMPKSAFRGPLREIIEDSESVKAIAELIVQQDSGIEVVKLFSQKSLSTVRADTLAKTTEGVLQTDTWHKLTNRVRDKLSKPLLRTLGQYVISEHVVTMENTVRAMNQFGMLGDADKLAPGIVRVYQTLNSLDPATDQLGYKGVRKFVKDTIGTLPNTDAESGSDLTAIKASMTKAALELVDGMYQLDMDRGELMEMQLREDWGVTRDRLVGTAIYAAAQVLYGYHTAQRDQNIMVDILRSRALHPSDPEYCAAFVPGGGATDRLRTCLDLDLRTVNTVRYALKEYLHTHAERQGYLNHDEAALRISVIDFAALFAKASTANTVYDGAFQGAGKDSILAYRKIITDRLNMISRRTNPANPTLASDSTEIEIGSDEMDEVMTALGWGTASVSHELSFRPETDAQRVQQRVAEQHSYASRAALTIPAGVPQADLYEHREDSRPFPLDVAEKPHLAATVWNLRNEPVDASDEFGASFVSSDATRTPTDDARDVMRDLTPDVVLGEYKLVPAAEALVRLELAQDPEMSIADAATSAHAVVRDYFATVTVHQGDAVDSTAATAASEQTLHEAGFRSVSLEDGDTEHERVAKFNMACMAAGASCDEAVFRSNRFQTSVAVSTAPVAAPPPPTDADSTGAPPAPVAAPPPPTDADSTGAPPAPAPTDPAPAPAPTAQPTVDVTLVTATFLGKPVTRYSTTEYNMGLWRQHQDDLVRERKRALEVVTADNVADRLTLALQNRYTIDKESDIPTSGDWIDFVLYNPDVRASATWADAKEATNTAINALVALDAGSVDHNTEGKPLRDGALEATKRMAGAVERLVDDLCTDIPTCASKGDEIRGAFDDHVRDRINIQRALRDNAADARMEGTCRDVASTTASTSNSATRSVKMRPSSPGQVLCGEFTRGAIDIAKQGGSARLIEPRTSPEVRQAVEVYETRVREMDTRATENGWASDVPDFEIPSAILGEIHAEAVAQQRVRGNVDLDTVFDTVTQRQTAKDPPASGSVEDVFLGLQLYCSLGEEIENSGFACPRDAPQQVARIGVRLMDDKTITPKHIKATQMLQVLPSVYFAATACEARRRTATGASPPITNSDKSDEISLAIDQLASARVQVVTTTADILGMDERQRLAVARNEIMHQLDAKDRETISAIQEAGGGQFGETELDAYRTAMIRLIGDGDEYDDQMIDAYCQAGLDRPYGSTMSRSLEDAVREHARSEGLAMPSARDAEQSFLSSASTTVYGATNKRAAAAYTDYQLRLAEALSTRVRESMGLSYGAMMSRVGDLMVTEETTTAAETTTAGGGDGLTVTTEGTPGLVLGSDVVPSDAPAGIISVEELQLADDLRVISTVYEEVHGVSASVQDAQAYVQWYDAHRADGADGIAAVMRRQYEEIVGAESPGGDGEKVATDGALMTATRDLGNVAPQLAASLKALNVALSEYDLATALHEAARDGRGNPDAVDKLAQQRLHDIATDVRTKLGEYRAAMATAPGDLPPSVTGVDATIKRIVDDNVIPDDARFLRALSTTLRQV